MSSLGTQWKLAFNGSFSGARLNTAVWGTCYPWQPPSGCTNFGNANEYEWYTPSQDQVSGGELRLVPQRLPTPGKTSTGQPKEYAFRSGMITTYPGYHFQYGYVQVVARIPYGPGLWPALWLLPQSERWPPEIDMIEHYGTSAISYQHLHSPDYPTQMAFEMTPGLSSGWHTFGLYWSKSQIVWYIDGQRVYETAHGIPQQAMYFLADLAVYQDGSENWPAGADDMAIRSVRIWQATAYPRAGHPLSPG